MQSPSTICSGLRSWVVTEPQAPEGDWYLPISVPTPMVASLAAEIYQAYIERWHIRQRFPQPDWSIVDCWVARHLLRRRWPPAQVREILQLASPQFPRRHSDPDNYLRRTIARAFLSPSPPCVCAIAN